MTTHVVVLQKSRLENPSHFLRTQPNRPAPIPYNNVESHNRIDSRPCQYDSFGILEGNLSFKESA